MAAHVGQGALVRSWLPLDGRMRTNRWHSRRMLCRTQACVLNTYASGTRMEYFAQNGRLTCVRMERPGVGLRAELQECQCNGLRHAAHTNTYQFVERNVWTAQEGELDSLGSGDVVLVARHAIPIKGDHLH